MRVITEVCKVSNMFCYNTKYVSLLHELLQLLKTGREEQRNITRRRKNDVFTRKVTKRKENIFLNAIPLHTIGGRKLQ
jgi:hypothetical protein